jgi:hypothetical protein
MAPPSSDHDQPVNERSGSLRIVWSRVRMAPEGLASAPWLVFAVLAPCAAAIIATNLAFATGAPAVETACVVVLMAATFRWLWWSFVRGQTKWRLQFGRVAPTLSASALALLAVVSFTS